MYPNQFPILFVTLAPQPGGTEMTMTRVQELVDPSLQSELRCIRYIYRIHIYIIHSDIYLLYIQIYLLYILIYLLYIQINLLYIQIHLIYFICIIIYGTFIFRSRSILFLHNSYLFRCHAWRKSKISNFLLTQQYTITRCVWKFHILWYKSLFPEVTTFIRIETKNLPHFQFSNSFSP